jgi:hypothetical protein
MAAWRKVGEAIHMIKASSSGTGYQNGGEEVGNGLGYGLLRLLSAAS